MKDIITASEIINVTASHCKVPIELIMGTSRKRELVKARHLSMYFIDMFIKDTVMNKSSFFAKSHCDLIHARHSVNNQAVTYKDYRMDLEVLRVKILDRLDCNLAIYKNYDTDLV
jgi:chromosomal replication initiator protein